MSFASIVAPLRHSVRSTFSRPTLHAVRSVHVSPLVSQQRQTTVPEDPFAEEVEEDDEPDLFGEAAAASRRGPRLTSSLRDTAAGSSRSAGRSRGDEDGETHTSKADVGNRSVKRARRGELLSRLRFLAGLQPSSARLLAVREGHARSGTLRKIIEYSTKARDLNMMPQLLRSWRFMGLQITPQTMSALVGRSYRLGRPDLLLSLCADPVQFGLPPMNASQFNRVHKAILDMENPPTSLPALRPLESFTISNAAWRLVALEHVANAATSAQGAEPAAADAQTPASDLQAFLAQLRSRRVDQDEKEAEDGGLRAHLDRVKAKGGEWADAVAQVEALKTKELPPKVDL